jgi:hypothetical protein
MFWNKKKKEEVVFTSNEKMEMLIDQLQRFELIGHYGDKYEIDFDGQFIVKRSLNGQYLEFPLKPIDVKNIKLEGEQMDVWGIHTSLSLKEIDTVVTAFKFHNCGTKH